MEVESALRSAAENKYWRRDDAEFVLSFWQQSGQSLAAFAREWGIGVPRLRRWRKRLGGEELPTFHPVKVVDVEMAPRITTTDLAGAVDVLVGGRRLIARPGFDDATFVRVLRLLESESC